MTSESQVQIWRVGGKKNDETLSRVSCWVVILCNVSHRESPGTPCEKKRQKVVRKSNQKDYGSGTLLCFPFDNKNNKGLNRAIRKKHVEDISTKVSPGGSTK
jgi:hypothetical protein